MIILSKSSKALTLWTWFPWNWIQYQIQGINYSTIGALAVVSLFTVTDIKVNKIIACFWLFSTIGGKMALFIAVIEGDLRDILDFFHFWLSMALLLPNTVRTGLFSFDFFLTYFFYNHLFFFFFLAFSEFLDFFLTCLALP